MREVAGDPDDAYRHQEHRENDDIAGDRLKYFIHAFSSPALETRRTDEMFRLRVETFAPLRRV